MKPEAQTAGHAPSGEDLSALAWVQDELRRSLESAHKALRRYMREAESLGGSDVDAVDPGVLRGARVQLHQGVGALELVGLPMSAQVLRASEAAVQRFATKPKLMNPAAVEAIERASFAVLDYLGRMLAGKTVSPLALYPQYAAVQTIAGADRVHPADLWPHDWQWRSLPPEAGVARRVPDDLTCSEVEFLVLSLMRQPERAAQQRMSDLCAELAAGAEAEHATLWRLASAFFEAQAAGLVPGDVHTKRLASRLLSQLRASMRGDTDVPERVAQDLLFYCVRAPLPADATALPRLAAVQAVWPADASAGADYGTVRLGLFDPAQIQQARRRVASAKDVWSAVAGGDLQRAAGLGESMALLADSLQRLFPGGEALARTLQSAAAPTVRGEGAPDAPLAMEVATSLLYVDAVLDDGDLDQDFLAERVQRLAQRIGDVASGAASGPLEPWMEELYRRTSDRQTMGSVVQELRSSLSEIEKQIDQYFRDPSQRDLLIAVPGQLQSIRSVLSVLGMDQASHAVLRMRDDVDALAETEVDAHQAVGAGTFDRLADNLGALSFLIDMISVQPQMAKSLFRFDPATGSLSAVMGQSERTSSFMLLDEPPADVPAPPAAAAPVAAPPPAPVTGLEDDLEMREVFLEEAREVIAAAVASLASLSEQPDDVAEFTSVRRAFHTLKGSSRMVGLTDFGEAAWACEQLYNVRLAQQARMDTPLQTFSGEALEYLAGWVDAIGEGRSGGHRIEAVAVPADALRLENRLLPVGASGLAQGETAAEGLFELPTEPSAEPTDEPFSALLEEPFSALLEEPSAGLLEEPSAGLLEEPSAGLLEEPLGELPAEPSADPAPFAALPTLPELEAQDAGAPEAEDEAQDTIPVASVTEETPYDDEAQPEHTGFSETLPALPDMVPGLPSAEDLELPLFDLGAEPAEAELAEQADADAPAERTGAEPAADVAAPASEPADAPAEPDFKLDLDALDALDLSPAEPPAAEPELPQVQGLDDFATPPEPEVTELSLDALDLDFGDAAPAPTEASPPPFVDPVQPDIDSTLVPEPEAEPGAEPESGVDAEPEPEAEAEAEAEAEPESTQAPEAVAPPPWTPEPQAVPEPPAEEEDPVKVIGTLRIPIPLFNIFLNEADEQSRRLVTELAEWALERHRPVSESAIALAHSLAGNSATVGFSDLSTLARSLEHSLMRSQAMGGGSADEAALFGDTAEEIRRLLHQFAAGFLHDAPASLRARLAKHERAAANELRDTSPDALDSAADDLPPAPPLHHGAAVEEDEDLDAVDQLDRDLFPIFEEEAEELLPQLRARLSDWVRRPSDHGAAEACMRTLHTFKGGARLAGAMRVGEMAHRLETEIEKLSAHGAATVPQVEHLLGRADAMASAFEALRKPAPPAQAEPPTEPATPPQTQDGMAADAPADAPSDTQADTEGDIQADIQADTRPDASADAEAAGPQPAFEASPPGATRAEPADAPTIDWSRFGQPALQDDTESLSDAGEAAARGGQGSVRVRAALLDRLVNHAGEVSITRARIESDLRAMQASLGDLTDNLDRLRQQLRDIELQAETQISSRMEAAKAALQSFDPLEMDRFTRFQELTRMMAESVNDVATVQRGLQRTLQSSEDELAMQARLTRELQDDLLRTRMVEFESLADRLYRVVRQAAKETGKSVKLDLVGGAIEIDRGVLERMVGPFEHLLRNCVAHGIEDGAARQQAGKDGTGLISVTALQEGNEVAVEVRDDGTGLDLARIRERAVARGLLEPYAQVDDEALAQMIFVPGFSTAEAVSGIAGRGVGMDVVRAEVTSMGGRIETRSEAGRGTSFKLLLPLTTAVTQVVMLRYGERRVAVPSTLVQIVRRVKTPELEAAYNAGAFVHDGVDLPFFWLGALLQDDARAATSDGSQTVVVMRSATQRVALHVDEVVGHHEVVVKNLGPQLARLPGLAGITLLPSGAVATIYNPVALANVYGDEARERMRARPGAAQPEQPAEPLAPAALPPLVMVVDDSLTVRRVTQRLLLREGYRVLLAKDGLDALEKLAGERPAILLSDIEMPRMDGFDLVRNVRADARLADLPVIMITSRIAQKHRDYAAELGVDHYLGKPYAEDELLTLVARHAGADITL